jgi:hypothetical protein
MRVLHFNRGDLLLSRLSEMESGDLSAIIVKDFVQPPELVEARSQLQTLPESHRYAFDKGAGWSFPRPLSLIVSEDSSNHLSDQSLPDTCVPALSGLMRILCDRITDLLGIPVRPITMSSSAGPVNAPMFTFRSLCPGPGKMERHRGDVLSALYQDTFYSRVEEPEHLGRRHYFGLFLHVQAPEGGGDLRLYNGESMDEYLDVKSTEGDLVIVNESGLWHEVTTVSGSYDRVTVGCFLTIDWKWMDGYVWS